MKKNKSHCRRGAINEKPDVELIKYSAKAFNYLFCPVAYKKAVLFSFRGRQMNYSCVVIVTGMV